MAKSCGSCNACCVAPDIEGLKPAWSACPHLCQGHKGCAIYSDRPAKCQTFSCGWRDSPNMPSRFRPDRCGIMLVGRPPHNLQAWELAAEWEGSRLEQWLSRFDDGYPVNVISRTKETV